MNAILIVDEPTARRMSEIGLEAWIRSENPSPSMLVMKWDGSLAPPRPGFELLSVHNPEPEADVVAVGPVCLYPRDRRVTVSGREVELKNKEFELLLHLMLNKGRVFTKEQLYAQLWGPESDGGVATVAVHINRIRQKIEQDPANPRLILTVYGAGYRFCEANHKLQEGNK